MQGKGDWKRPTDEKKVAENWDEIRWNSSKEKSGDDNSDKNDSDR